MAFKTSSKQKTSTSSAVSSSSSGSGGGVAISQVYITDASYVNLDDTAIGTSGGYLKLVGSGFVTGCVVYVNNAAVTTTFVSSSEVRAVIPSAAAGTYSLTIFNTNGGGSIWASGLAFSGFPTVTTSSYTSTTGAVVNTQIVATGDGTLSYSLQGGSTLPAGVTLSSTGLVSGTASAISANTVVSFTVLVNDSQNQTVQQAITISLIFGDLYFKNVTSLLSGDTFTNTTDSSTNKFAVTATGSPVASNLTPFQGSYSASFNGSSQKLTIPTSSALNMGSGDFTVECWVYWNGSSLYYQNFIGSNSAGFTGNATFFRVWGSGFGTTALYNKIGIGNPSHDGVSSVYSTNSLIANTWTHVAATRSSGIIKLFMNGTLEKTGSTDTSTYDFGDNGLCIGDSPWDGANGWYGGYISNARIVKGTAVYTANFTPSTIPLTAISGTSLLTLQDNYIKDNSTNAFAITNVAGTSVSQRTPFEITPSVTLGSTSFNGSSQYMTLPSNSALALGTGDFTVEFWFNVQGAGDNTGQHIFQTRDGTNNGILFQYDRTNKTLAVLSDTGLTGLITSSNAIVDGTWYHTSVSRSGSTIYFFVNGTQIATTTSTQNFNSTTTYISRRFATDGALHYFNGYLSNLRVVKGTAVYTANFTPSTSPLTAITNTSLLTLQSPVASNNNTFLDSSPNTFAVTRVGTPAQGSVSPFGSNWSNYFDGTGDYLTVPDNAATTVGSADFTLECWIYPTSFANNQYMWFHRSDSTLAIGLGFGLEITTGNIRLFAGDSDSAAWEISHISTSGVTLNTWSHVAVTRSSSTWKIYVNGSIVSTITSSVTVFDTGLAYIGSASTTSGLFSGYISNLRLVKATAVYTANFTPSTTPLTAISGTSLLTCQSNRFIDSSTNNFAITKVGDTAVSRYSPFSTTTGYVPSIHGGSMYFSGTGQCLTVPDGAAFEMSGDFTLEAWFYMTATTIDQEDIITKGMSGFYQPYSVYVNSSNAVTLKASSNGSTWDVANAITFGTIALNTWNHVAVSRSGTAMRLFLNGALNATVTNGSALYNNTYPVGIGGRSDATELFTGYISNVRIVNGTALYTAAFTPSTTPLTAVKNTVLLLAGTNAGIIDSSMQSNYSTVGDSKVSSGAVKYGTGSISFDGTGDYLTSPNYMTGIFGTGNFTIEAWVYTTVSSGTQAIFDTRLSDASTTGIYFGMYSSNALLIYTSGVVLTGGTVPANTWTHIALVRNGTTITGYVNGISVVSGTRSNNFTDTNVQIGSSPFVSGSTINSYSGYIDDLRVTKGFARYTANFTPSAEALLKN